MKPPPPPPPPPPPEAMKRATPENRRLAELIDTLDQLDDAALKQRARTGGGRRSRARRQGPGRVRAETRSGRVPPPAAGSAAELEVHDASATGAATLRAIAHPRGTYRSKLKQQTGGPSRRRWRRSPIRRRSRRTSRSSRSRPRLSAEELQDPGEADRPTDLLSDSLKSMARVLSSYGLPATTAMLAAERVYHGASLDEGGRRRRPDGHRGQGHRHA